MKTDTITIRVTGTKKFRQKIIDVIYEALIEDEVQFEGTKPGNGFDLDSTIVPSEVKE
jgi:hypothetical protein